MADDLNTEIKIGADASGVEAGVGRAKRSLASLGDAAKKAGKEGGEGIGSIGAGGDKAAEKVERATRNMQNSIQRQIAVMQAGSKESREYWEALASQRGLDANALRPYLDQLQRVTEETNKAKEATDGLMDQAKGLGVVLGTAIAGLMAGFTLDKFIQETIGAQQEQAQLAAVLKSTGEAARFSQAQLNDMADSLSASSVFSGGDINQAQTRLLAYTGIVGKEFPRAMQNVIDMAARMGMSVTSSAETIGRALDVPSEGLTALTRQGFKFSEAQKQLVESLEATGRTGEAQAIIMDALESSYSGAAEAAAGTLGGALAQLQNQIDDLMTGGDGSINGMTAMVKTASGVVGDFAVILDAATEAMSGMENGTGALSTVQESLATFFETIAVLANETIYVLRQTGDTLGGLAAGYKAFFSFDFDAVRAIGAEMKANGEAARKEIDATTARILNARKEAGIYASYATRNASAATDPRRIDLSPASKYGAATPGKPKKEELSDYDKLIQKLGVELPKAAAEAEAAQLGYNKAQTEFLALAGSDVWAKFTNTQRATVAALFAQKIVSEEAVDAQKRLDKANLDAAASREKYITSLSTGLDKIQADIAAQIEATERMGLSKEAIADLDAAKLEMLATDLELQAIKAMDRNLDQQTYDALKQQAQAYRELGIAKKGGAAKEAALDLEKANAEAAKKAQEDWERASEQINNTLTDALMRGFESGKDFAKNMRDTVVNMFKTMVLRPVISAIISPVAGALTGALGLSGAARAGQSGGGVGDIISTASNAYNMLNKGVSSGIEAGFSKFATSSAGQSLGLSSAGVAGNNPSAFVGPQLTATGSQMGAALGVVGNTLAGYALGSMAKSLLSGGYSVSGGVETFQKVGIAVGSALGGPLVGSIVGAAAGVVNRLFGRKLKDSGIEGSFGGEAGFEGNSYQYMKGGLFRSNKTKTSDLDSGVQDYLSQSFKRMQTQTGAFAETLGLQSDKVASFTSAIKLSLKDLDEKAATAALEGAVKQAGNDLAQTVLGGNTFAKAGEEASATLARLAVSLSATNGWLDTLGLTLRETSLASAAASSTFIEMFGSVDAFTASMSSYYENFYSEAERMGKATASLTAELAKSGIALPTSKDAYRALVTEQINAGEAGQELAAKLLLLSPAFAQVADYAEQAAKELAEKAAEAAKALQEDAARAAEEAARRAAAIAQERAGLEKTLLTALGDTVALRRQELDALDASNRALKERIWALEDAKAAEQKARTGVESAYSALEKSVAAEKQAINDRLQAQKDGYQTQIDAAQEAANTIKSIASALASAVKSTQIDSDSFSFQRLKNARSTIGSAASTGNLQYAGLEDALGVAGQDSKKFYGRFEDYAFDQGVLAGNVGKLNDQAQGQLTTAEKTLQVLKDQMGASSESARAQLSALDAQLLEQKNLVDAALGIDNSVLSVKAAIDGLQGAIAGLAAAQAASAIAKAQGSSSILGGAGYGSGGGGGGGGTPYEGPTYTDFMGNQVALQAGQSRQFQDAVAAAGTAAVSGLSELRDRLQALGKSDIWEALSKDLTLNYQDFDHTGGRGVPTISASDGVVSVAGYRHDNQSVQDYAAKISAWAQANGVQGSTNNGYSQSDISNAINTTLGQGASVADILNAGAVNFGLTEQEIREAARAAGIPGFATGINRVPHDMLARIHKDEAVVPAAYNPYNPGASAPGNSEVVAELRKLNERMARIEASSNATAGHTAGTDRKLARVIRNDAMITEALPA